MNVAIEGLAIHNVIQACEHTCSLVDANGVWPVRFDSHCREPFLLNEAVGDVGTVSVKFVGAVGSIADQNNLGIACVGMVKCGRPRECDHATYRWPSIGGRRTMP